MTLPGFTAEVAASGSASAYATLATAGGVAAVVAAAVGGLHFPVIRCCRRAPLLGNRFVCTQRAKLPWETCTCVATMSGPVFLCQGTGPVFEQA
jgi:hypothetical protein